jgi:hypothetical protein
MSDAELTKDLIEKTREIERMSDTIVRAAEGRRELPTPFEEALKNIGALTGECEEVLAELLDQSPAKEILEKVVSALNAVHSGVDSLVIFKALEGSTYETRTVAND